MRNLMRNFYTYLEMHPGSTAHVVAAEVGQMKGMRAHGLTARKVGYHLPRMVEDVVMRNENGRRIYYLLGDEPPEKKKPESLEEKLD